jgi:hypothetical protein
MALGTPFDRVELGLLLAVAGVFAFAQPLLTPPNPLVRMAYFLASGLLSLLSATLLRALRLRYDLRTTPP